MRPLPRTQSFSMAANSTLTSYSVQRTPSPLCSAQSAAGAARFTVTSLPMFCAVFNATGTASTGAAVCL